MTWNGGFYATPNIAGSRAGYVIAGSWAALMKTGASGYIENTKLVLSACRDLKRAIIAEVPEVAIGTHSDSSIVAIIGKPGNNAINPIALCDVFGKYH